MPTRRLEPNATSIILQARSCEHPDHAPKDDLPPGSYVHDCPGCKTSYIFTITEKDRKG